MRLRSPRARCARATPTSSTAPRPGSPTAARPTSTASCAVRRTTGRAASPACSSTARPRASPPARRSGRWASRGSTDRAGGLRGRLRRGGPAHGRGGAGVQDRSRRPRRRPARHRGVRGRRRPERARRRRSAGPRSAGSSARPLIDFQGLAFLLSDMATGVEAGRASYLEAARRRDRGEPFGRQAAMAKLFCTDMAMRVTTDAVQVLGGYGYVAGLPGRAADARGQGAADRRGHQPGAAHGHRPPPRALLTAAPPRPRGGPAVTVCPWRTSTARSSGSSAGTAG